MKKSKGELSLEALFKSDGEFKHRSKLSPFFTRKPYQYTPAEINDEGFEKIRKLKGDIVDSDPYTVIN